MESNNKLQSFTYKVFRKIRKTIGIKITNKGEVIVTSPFGISEETIDRIVKKKTHWILNKLNMIKNQNLEEKTILNNGTKILYLGVNLKLELVCGKESNYEFLISHGMFKVYLDYNIRLDQHKIKKIIANIYKREAERILVERTKFYSEIISEYPLKIRIKNQKTLWGSCSSKKNINYNYKIIMAPIEVVDYVVVHELCHLIHMNHSPKYWSAVQKILPDYRVRRQWLKDNGFKLMRSLED
ncbi:M48 family metallopeptidase [Clostridium sp. P21]|uniref:M48 family metallopeptidase n=1 Tax=Clostridium muellerianum TaxID=2716538 RepID=A0A7Y0HQS2_9CLOT|nr:M48 family metallopeptidase [Clostridium muellerianum]